MVYKKEDRKLDKVQYESIRKKIDKKFNKYHDDLSEAYYNKTAFKGFGVLSKETFDKLHALLFCEYDKAFHEENLTADVQLDAEKYDGKKYTLSLAKIASAKIEGIEIKW